MEGLSPNRIVILDSYWIVEELLALEDLRFINVNF